MLGIAALMFGLGLKMTFQDRRWIYLLPRKVFSKAWRIHFSVTATFCQMCSLEKAAVYLNLALEFGQREQATTLSVRFGSEPEKVVKAGEEGIGSPCSFGLYASWRCVFRSQSWPPSLQSDQWWGARDSADKDSFHVKALFSAWTFVFPPFLALFFLSGLGWHCWHNICEPSWQPWACCATFAAFSKHLHFLVAWHQDSQEASFVQSWTMGPAQANTKSRNRVLV